MKKIAILASGSGSNAENLFRHFADSAVGRVSVIITDNSHAFVLERAARLGVPTLVIPRRQWREEGTKVLKVINGYAPDYIVLAGFLSLIPAEVISAYRGRLINIHPALLPSYGGRGMYGDNVHRAVVAAGEKESGITIHHVNEKYDDGAIIAQYRLAVTPEDTPETLAAKIHELEYAHYPHVVEGEIRKLQ